MKTERTTKHRGGIGVVMTAVALAMPVAEAADFHLKPELSGTTVDWQAADSYVEEDGVPGGEDIVFLPQGCKVTVTDGTIAGLNRILQILPAQNAEITFDLANDANLDCIFTGSRNDKLRGDYGKGIKKGSGTLNLTKNGIRRRDYGGSAAGVDYDVNWTIEAGTLVSSPAVGDYKSAYLGRIEVQENGIFVPGCPSSGSGFNYCRSLTGAGIVSNAVARKLVIHEGSGCAFPGRIRGMVSPMSRGGTRLDLTGVESDFSGTAYLWGNGILGFSYLGTKASTMSSIGAGSVTLYCDDAGEFVYLGDGEETDRDLTVSCNANSTCKLNGGRGGLVFNKNSIWTPGIRRMQRLILTGTNETPCVMRGTLKTGDGNVQFCMSKTGSGTWIMENDRTYPGAWIVSEGTLGFDSLEEVGTNCALGVSTLLRADVAGSLDPSAVPFVDYAFLLGSPTTEGTLEFTGTNLTACISRPLKLAGDGRLRNNSQVSFRFSGITPQTAGAKTLTLDGACTNENEVAGIVDTEESHISIVKEGTGCWTLNGSNVIRGSVSVKVGRLTVRRDDGRYTWFRFVARGSYKPDWTYCQLQEIGLYDKDGNRLNSGLTWSGFEHQTLRPGEVAMPRRHSTIRFYNSTPDRMFDGKCGGDGTVFNFVYGASSNPIRPTDPTSWVPIVMRLPVASVEEVASYDVCQYRNMGKLGVRDISEWTLQGSCDGMNWDTLSVTNMDDAALYPESKNNVWTGRRTVYAGDAADLPHEGGYAIRGRTIATPGFTVMDTVEKVSVAAGAEFVCEGTAATIRGLEVDAAGAGTISNFVLSAEGRLTVRNADASARSVTLPGVYLGDGETLGNLADWALTVNDREASNRYRTTVRDGVVTITKVGLVILFR